MTVIIFVKYIWALARQNYAYLAGYLVGTLSWYTTYSLTQKQKVFPSSTKPPSGWSKALFTTTHKKDVRSNPSNYRPISLTCVGCTIMEHIMRNYISKHLSTNDIIIYHQHGFRQKFSCETQLISAINDWVKSINHRTQTDVILLDFEKAFDSVPHQCLLSKLNCNGIRDRSLD